MTRVRGEAEKIKKAGRRIRRSAAITESLIISLCSSVSITQLLPCGPCPSTGNRRSLSVVI